MIRHPVSGAHRVRTQSGSVWGAPDREAAILASVRRALRAWQPLDSGAPPLLGDLSHALGVTGAVLWVTQDSGLLARSTWAANSTDLQLLKCRPTELSLDSVHELPVRSWERRETVCATFNLSDSASSRPLRRSMALLPLLAVPAVTPDEVLGVVELHGRALLRLDHGGLDALDAAGQLLGSLLDRWRFQDVHSILTESERDLLRFASDGVTTKEIASELLITARQVETRFEHIRLKLQVADRSTAVAHAFGAGTDA
jgi:DNA-binding CsgD family transcriptional regulator